MTINELIGAISYTLAFMLAESIFIFVCILTLISLVPKRWIGPSTVPYCIVLIFELTILAISLHYFTLKGIPIRRLLIIVAFLSAMGIAFGITRTQKLNNLYIAVIKRLTPLTLIYVFIDFLALIIVITRNL